MENCVFCQIIEKKLPSTILYEDDAVIVIKDRAPKAPIHYLIIPKKHIPDINSLKNDDYSVGSVIFKTAQKIPSLVSQAENFNLLVNNGFNAGQRVFHLHTHFLAGKRISEVG
jgi:histidine triad (HIT) family protein